MNARWNYQVTYGLFFGIVMVIVSGAFELLSKPFTTAFLTYNFVVKCLIMIAFGIFVIGYINWRYLRKQDNK